VTTSEEALTIGEVAERVGLPAKTIRYYEEAGLVAPAARAKNGYRVYDARALEVLGFVKRARDLGFGMDDVAELLALLRDERRASADVRFVALRHLVRVQRKLVELERLRAALSDLIERCANDEHAGCAIIEELAGRAPARQKPQQKVKVRRRR